MRIAVLALGSRGDVYPLTALAAELARHGHEVRVGASLNLVDLPRQLGLDVVPVGWDQQSMMQSERGREWVTMSNLDSFLQFTIEAYRDYGRQFGDEAITFTAGCEAIVCAVVSEQWAATLAEAYDVPLVAYDLTPARPNDVVPHPLVAADPLPTAAANRATYLHYTRRAWRYRRDLMFQFRSQLGLPPMPPPPRQQRRPLELQGYSPTLVPGLTWDAYRPIVGDLRLTPADLHRAGMSTLDPELARWLAAGEPPALLTFGSTHVPDPAAMMAGISRACRSLGVRALVATGWGLSGVAPSSTPQLRVVPYVDYDLVLPHCAMVVHHGSASITAAGVRAGIPTMVCSSYADQPFWGRQLERLGAGVHVRFTELSEDVLRSGMSRLTTDPLRRRAAQLGEQIRAEPHGTLVAADEVDRYLAA
ncbi:UDP:flavonoid glycosyltransferase YjiC, YdhE family [Micromonospora matsumotoense]|uniref:UDP:flavonoid glycosyltransferase YjiC, YdhE family n=1 Tax=Micromonospora matsumotoense TaxID=121616 RepID=A0A1C4Z390_9ACTN|nr:glycosyltransferase [Micromonospora matsumotoense]SCF27403.1 UDP:flavonoid glycosyltransferase YjiC, YdhE family [Micromonospora matsumotoense]